MELMIADLFHIHLLSQSTVQFDVGNEILSFSLVTWLMKEERHRELSTLKIS